VGGGGECCAAPDITDQGAGKWAAKLIFYSTKFILLLILLLNYENK